MERKVAFNLDVVRDDRVVKKVLEFDSPGIDN